MMTSPNAPRHRLMWRIYALVWLAYAVFLAVADQLDNVSGGRFDLPRFALTIVSLIPSALLLALVWPLTGWLERREYSLPRILSIHIAAAIAFAVLAQGPFWSIFKAGKPLSWYIWPLLYHAMTYLLGAGIFHLIRAGEKAHRQALAMKDAQNLVIASELSALRNKLNPHFLFNTLHSIIALTQRNPAAAETALFQFSDMLRYVLDTERSGSDRVTLDQELDFVRDYLELEQLRLGQRLHVDWDLDEDAGDHPLPALSLQPLVENSIKHAFNPHTRPGILQIRTRRDATTGALTITVRDTGPGADPASIASAPGLGLRTIERRLQLDYGSRAAMRVQSAPGAGFSVSLTIPAVREESFA
ncbi:sensor histidine kinase [Massilia sp. IC2-476]|uniref:sensor histidine kinase n=1 Tax=Massilia sp. IC2-476 TaxID=2887199 RepID=UPI001D11BA58|nr:histidine kinase [Massilia sp. IC2-476]MCC2973377.1 histidine kinase [Massilia sp. IC2-476]